MFAQVCYNITDHLVAIASINQRQAMPCQIDTIDQSARPPTSSDHTGEPSTALEELPSSATSSQACRQPLFCHWPQYGSHLEARGWAYDAVGRSLSFIGNAAFVGTAVVQLARIDGVFLRNFTSILQKFLLIVLFFIQPDVSPKMPSARDEPNMQAFAHPLY